MIKLVKSSFYNEKETKQKLVDFILKSDVLAMGTEAKKFEEKFAKKQERRYTVFANSGSSANLILIQAMVNLGKLKRGDKVGVSAVTWSTNIMPIIQLGLVPVVIDCELETLNVSPRTLKPYLFGKGKLKALFLTNVLGLSDNIAEIARLCKKEKIIFLEDNCESLGSRVGKKLLGNFGLASTFSFFVGHHMSTLEGGMIATDDEELYHMLLIVRAHGWDRNLPKAKQDEVRASHKMDDFFAKFAFYDLAFNLRPTDIHGFLGNNQIDYWDEIVGRRSKNFEILHERVKNNHELISYSLDHMDIVSNFAMPVIAKNEIIFKKYKKRFEDADVEIRPIITGDITKQPFFKKYVKASFKCPNADHIHWYGFYFGNNPELTEKELAYLSNLLAA